MQAQGRRQPARKSVPHLNLTRNSVRFGDALPTTILARPTPSQTRAFELLNLKIAA